MLSRQRITISMNGISRLLISVQKNIGYLITGYNYAKKNIHHLKRSSNDLDIQSVRKCHFWYRIIRRRRFQHILYRSVFLWCTVVFRKKREVYPNQLSFVLWCGFLILRNNLSISNYCIQRYWKCYYPIICVKYVKISGD